MKKLNRKKIPKKKKILKPTNKVKKTKRRIQKIDSTTSVVNLTRKPGRPKNSLKKPKDATTESKGRVKGTVYFTPETETAIVEYNSTPDLAEKNKIYDEKIQHAFSKIAENVYNTFKFSYAEVSPVEIQKQAISHMVANIDKYEKGKGKAFSYFSIVAKHWFILDNNTTYRRFKKHVEICEHPGDSGEFVVEPEHRRKDTETREFIRLMVEYWDKNVGKYFSKPRDLKIANAVVEIFRNADRIDVFNKKALYLYIREIADCQTQHITKVINKLKRTQRLIQDEYRDTGNITGANISDGTIKNS